MVFQDDLFLTSGHSPLCISANDNLNGGETSIYSSFDAYSMAFFENTKAGAFLDTPIITSPAYYMDLIVRKDEPASSFFSDGSSFSVSKFASNPWDVEYPVAVINPALISKPKENYPGHAVQPTTIKNEGEYIDPGLTLKAAEHRIQSDHSHLDLISLQSYSVINVPFKKVCRGRRVPTVEMMQKRLIKSIDWTDKKPGRDAFTERRFVCAYADCRKCFKRREHLIRHQRSAHSSEKPFRCPVDDCLVSCNRKDNMHQHMRNAHCKGKLTDL